MGEVVAQGPDRRFDRLLLASDAVVVREMGTKRIAAKASTWPVRALAMRPADCWSCPRNLMTHHPKVPAKAALVMRLRSEGHHHRAYVGPARFALAS